MLDRRRAGAALDRPGAGLRHQRPPLRLLHRPRGAGPEIHVAEMRAIGQAPRELVRNMLNDPPPEPTQPLRRAARNSGPKGSSSSGPATAAAATTKSTTPRTGKPAREDPPHRPVLRAVLAFTVPPSNPYANSSTRTNGGLDSYGLRNPYPLLLRPPERRPGDRRRRPGRARGDRLAPPRPASGSAPTTAGTAARASSGPATDRAARSRRRPSSTRSSTTPIHHRAPQRDHRRLRRPRSEPAANLSGRYLYGDLCVGEIRSLVLSAPSPATAPRASTSEPQQLRRRLLRPPLRRLRRRAGLPPRRSRRGILHATGTTAGTESLLPRPPRPAPQGHAQQTRLDHRLGLTLRRSPRTAGQPLAGPATDRHAAPRSGLLGTVQAADQASGSLPGDGEVRRHLRRSGLAAPEDPHPASAPLAAAVVVSRPSR